MLWFIFSSYQIRALDYRVCCAMLSPQRGSSRLRYTFFVLKKRTSFLSCLIGKPSNSVSSTFFAVDCIYNSLNPTAGFKYPNNCGAESQVQCDYAIKWTWRTGKDTLEVTIISKFRDQWNGVGFAYNAGKVTAKPLN